MKIKSLLLSLPCDSRTLLLSIMIVLDRLTSLPNSKRDDFCEMFELYAKSKTTEQKNAIEELFCELFDK